MEIQEKEFEKLEAVYEKYYELLMAVQNKHPTESRHQTALRLIREAQRPPNQANSVDPLGEYLKTLPSESKIY